MVGEKSSCIIQTEADIQEGIAHLGRNDPRLAPAIALAGLRYPAVWMVTSSHLDAFGLGTLAAVAWSRRRDLLPRKLRAPAVILATGGFDGWTVLLQESSQQQFSAEFSSDSDVQALQHLNPPVFEGNEALFYRVFQKWGTHFIDKITVGGIFNYYAAVNSNYSSQQTQISANLSLEYSSLLVDAAAKAKTDWQSLGQTWSSDRLTTWKAFGGDTSLLAGIPPSTSYGENFNEAYQNWVNSIMQNPAPIGFHLSDLSTLFAGELASAISDALTAYTNKGVYAQADFSTFTSGTSAPELTNYSEVILFNGANVPNPAAAPAGTDDVVGMAQLAVFDSTTLEMLVNTGAYFDYTTGTVQAAFWDDPRVLTVSVHESGRALFPGTGWARRLTTIDNMPLLDSLRPFKDTRRPVMQQWLRRITNDPGYVLLDGYDGVPVSPEQRSAALFRSDTLLTFDPETYEEATKIVNQDILPADIIQVKLMQDWYWDERFPDWTAGTYLATGRAIGDCHRD